MEESEMNEQWWKIKVYDPVSSSCSHLSKYGNLDDIIQELKEDGLWQFVSANPEEEE